MIRDLRKYPWMLGLLQINDLMGKLLKGRSGTYRRANAESLGMITNGIIEMLEGVFYGGDRLVLHEDMVPPEILSAMGLKHWMAEFLGIVMPMLNPRIMEEYIDVAENEGIPPDVCSLPKSTMGLTLAGNMPQPSAIVTSNLPCDGGMNSYSLIEKKLGVPIFRLDIPHNFHNERALDYFVGELKRMIGWLELHTPGRMDWDRLREICLERNKASEIELELWDLIRQKPAPMAGEPIYLTHLMYMQASPGSPRGTRTYAKILEYAKKIHQTGLGAVPNERYRTVLWNPPTIIFPDLHVWAEQAYGVSLIMDMLTYNRHPFVDTSTPDTMLRSLAQIIMEGPMARHTRGPAENFFGDLFHMVEHFSLDMIWMAAHIGCKNTQALSGMFREKCREREIPLLFIDYDLSDTRIVSPEGMKQQVEQFMETVMRAEKNGGPKR